MVELNPSERRTLRLAALLVALGVAVRLGTGPGDAAFAWRSGAGAAPSTGQLQEARQAVGRSLERERRASLPLAPGERLDPNSVDPVELRRLPGVGPATARAIVEHRRRQEPFRRMRDLLEVPGVGPATLRRLAPHVALPEEAPGRSGSGDDGRVDVNSASVEELEELPGIGPALAGRIVVLRRRKGGFRALDELLEVKGIGPATLERLRPRAVLR